MKTMYASVAAMVLIAMAMGKADAQVSTDPGENCPEQTDVRWWFMWCDGWRRERSMCVCVCVSCVRMGQAESEVYMGV